MLLTLRHRWRRCGGRTGEFLSSDFPREHSSIVERVVLHKTLRFSSIPADSIVPPPLESADEQWERRPRKMSLSRYQQGVGARAEMAHLSLAVKKTTRRITTSRPEANPTLHPVGRSPETVHIVDSWKAALTRSISRDNKSWCDIWSKEYYRRANYSLRARLPLSQRTRDYGIKCFCYLSNISSSSSVRWISRKCGRYILRKRKKKMIFFDALVFRDYAINDDDVTCDVVHTENCAFVEDRVETAVRDFTRRDIYTAGNFHLPFVILFVVFFFCASKSV